MPRPRSRSRQTSKNRLGTFFGKKDWRGERIGILGGLREILLAILCGILPWWFGANDPPAVALACQIILVISLLTLAESVVIQRRQNLTWGRILFSVPAMAFLLIGIYGLIQWAEVGPQWLARLSRSRHESWKAWGGQEQLALPGDASVYRQRASLAWLGDEVLESVIWLGVLWALVVSVMRLPGRWGPLRRHAAVMVVSGVAMGLQSMLQAMTFTGKILWIRQAGIVISSAGPFFVHSHLAAYLNLGLGFALAHVLFLNWNPKLAGAEEHLFTDERTGAGRGFLGIYAVGLLMVSVLAARSRGGMLAMVLGGCVLGLTVLYAGRRMRRISAGPNNWLWLIALAVVVSVSLTMLTDVFAIFSSARGIVGGAGGHAAGIRRLVWGLAWRTWRQAPLWGTGWGSFVWASQTQYRPSVDHNTHAESDYVQVLPEGGLLGVVLVLVALVALLAGCLRLLRRLNNPGQFALVAGALFGLTAAAWGSLTENNLRTAGVALPVLVTAAHVIRLSVGWKWFEGKLSSDEAETTRVGLAERLVGLVVGVVLVGVASAGVWQTGQVNKAWGILRPAGLRQAGTDLIGEVSSQTSDASLENARVALPMIEAVLPGWGDYHLLRMLVERETFQRRLKAELVAEGVSEKEAGARSQVLQIGVLLNGLPEGQRAEAKKSLMAEPLMANHMQVAAQSLTRAWRDQPSSSMVHMELAAMNWLVGRGPSVKQCLERALGLANDRIDMLLRVGQVGKALGEESLAVEAFSRCLDVPEYRPEGWYGQMNAWITPGMLDAISARSARVAVRAGEELVGQSDVAGRRKLGEKALEMLRQPGSLTDAESAWLRARATWLIGDRVEGLSQMKMALALNPEDLEVRALQIDWLIQSDRATEAVEQARVMMYLWPNDPMVKNLLEKAVDAEARGPGRREEGAKP
jgi:O-antigen ligase